MTQRLIYVIGPSGAGKDSVLQGLRDTWSDMPPAHWARRTITRCAQAGGEAHESVSEAEFKQLEQQQLFALHWRANDLHYGIRHSELNLLDQGHCVFVNGSRGHLPIFLAKYPTASVVHITAPVAVLQRRLIARQRESEQAIANRLARAVNIALPAHAIEIQNDRTLEAAVSALRSALAVRLATASG